MNRPAKGSSRGPTAPLSQGIVILPGASPALLARSARLGLREQIEPLHRMRWELFRTKVGKGQITNQVGSGRVLGELLCVELYYPQDKVLLKISSSV